MSESEIIRFIQTWVIVYACLTYTFVVGKIVLPGKVRFLFISPVVALFLFLLLPLCLTSVSLCCISTMLFAWIGTFKLALFSFGKGPLATDYPTITFIRFLAVGSLPIILSSKSKVEGKKGEIDNPILMKTMAFAVKAFLYALLYKMYMFKAQLHPTVIFYLYGIHLCLSLELIVSIFRAVARSVLGLELDSQFNEPALSTSVQDYWGRRWNLAVGSILRAGVYDPVRALLSPHVGRKHAQRVGVLATFATSALMHELLFYYLSRKQPNWEATWFFLLHGMTVVVETDVKRQIGLRWRLPRLVSIVLTLGFLAVTGLWLICPQFYRCNGHVRAAEEFAAFMAFLQSLRSFQFISGSCVA